MKQVCPACGDSQCNFNERGSSCRRYITPTPEQKPSLKQVEEGPERIWLDRRAFYNIKPMNTNDKGAYYVPESTVEALRAELAEKERYRLALESLTPQGSEYVNDPDACVAVVRSYRRTQHERIIKLTKENNALRANQATVPSDEVKHRLLHTLWTKAVDTKGYDKNQWRELERLLLYQANYRT